MIASVIFKCSKVSTTPIYATIIENPCCTNNNYHGEKIHRPLPTSRGARQRRGDRTQGARARSQPKKAGDTSQVFRPKSSWSKFNIRHDQLQAEGAVHPSLACCFSVAKGGAFWKPSILVSCPSESNRIFRMFQRNEML